MQLLVSAVAVVVLLLFGVDVAHASAPDYLIGLPVKWWVVVLIVAVAINYILTLKK